MRKLYLFVYFIIVPWVLLAQSESVHILLLHSYHEEFSWSKRINDEVKKELEAHWSRLRFSTEYLDTKRFEIEEIFPRAAEYFSVKYLQDPPDIIICSDNNALLFLKEFRKILFPDIPIFFCGINEFSQDLIQGMEPITGVVENVDLMGSLNLITRMVPRLQELVLISDNTTTSEALLQELSMIPQELSSSLEIHNYQEVYKPELIPILENLNKNSAVLFLSYYREAPLLYLSAEEAVQMISSHTEAPVFVLWDFAVGTGAVGGLVTSAANQVDQVSRQVLEYLNKGNIEDLEIVTLSPNQYIFDYQRISEYTLNWTVLPEDTIYLNKPVTIYEQNKELVLSVTAFLLILMLLVIYLFLDISRRRQLEKKLNTQKQVLSDILTHIPLTVYWKDKRGQDIGSNTEERLQKRSEKSISKEEKERLKYWEQQQIPKGSSLLFQEDAWPDLQGKLHYYQIAIIPIEDENSYLGRITLIQDITEKKGIEFQLKQSQKMESLGRMAGGVAHDFNNMLTGITAAADLIDQNCDIEEIKEYANMILDTADQAHDLVSGLLSYARKKPLTMKALPVLKMVEETVGMLERTIKKTVKIQVQEKAENLQIMGDPSMLKSALLNLGINSDDAMPRGGSLKFIIDKTVLKEHNSAQLSPGPYLKLYVSDTGEGISKKYLDKLFDPFFTTKEPGKGTGLGLAGVLGAAGSHGGTVEVISNTGKGSTFILYIPVK